MDELINRVGAADLALLVKIIKSVKQEDLAHHLETVPTNDIDTAYLKGIRDEMVNTIGELDELIRGIVEYELDKPTV